MFSSPSLNSGRSDESRRAQETIAMIVRETLIHSHGQRFFKDYGGNEL